MMLSISDLKELASVAESAALAAGKYIQLHPASSVSVYKKESGSSSASQVVTDVDLYCQRLILEKLFEMTQRFDLGILTEELDDDGSRLGKDFFWAIDPLDGTLAFVEGVEGYAVSIGLVSQNGESVLGVVYNPVSDKMYSAIQGVGVRCNGAVVSRSNEQKNELTLYCDRGFFNHFRAQEYCDQLRTLCMEQGKKLTVVENKYGAVMNGILVFENPQSLFVKLPKDQEGGGCIWDYAATSCIVSLAGGFVGGYKGSSIDLNSSTTLFMNLIGVLYVSDSQFAPSLIACHVIE